MFQEMRGKNETLEMLNFEMCKLGKQGGDMLVEFLKGNSSIQFLNIGSAGIAEKTWPKLLQVIEDKMNITGFSINKCDERVGDIIVRDLIATSPRLTDINGRCTVRWSGEEYKK